MEDAKKPATSNWQSFLTPLSDGKPEPSNSIANQASPDRQKDTKESWLISPGKSGLMVGIGVLAGVLLTLTLQAILLSPTQESFVNCVEQWQLSDTVTASKPTVLIAPLIKDPGGNATSDLLEGLNRFQRNAGLKLFDLQEVPCFISADRLSVLEGANEAEQAAKYLADVTDAKAVIWGEVLDHKRQLKVFATYSEGLEDHLYSSDQFTIPMEVSGIFGKLIAATVWLSTTNATPFNEQKSVDELRMVLDALELADNEFDQSSSLQKAQRYRVTAQARFQLGVQEQDATLLETAIEEFAIAADAFAKSGFHDNWAQAQNGLGLALLAFGRMQNSLPEIHMAISSFETALTQSNQARSPLKWAATTVNLADALSVLGPREPNDEKLKKAVQKYRSALQIYTLERAPLEWASLQHSLGTTLQSIGQKHQDFDSMRQAADAYSLALQIRTPEISRAGFIASQTSLGASLHALAELGAGDIAMISAIDAYRAALSQIDRQTHPTRWAALQHSLGRSLLARADVHPGVDFLHQAKQAFVASLTVFSKSEAPAMWAVAQNNRGNVLQELGRRERDVATVQAAIGAYESALEVFADTSSTYAKSVIQNLSRSQALLQSLNKAN